MTLRARLGLLSLVTLFGLSVPVFGVQGLTFPPDGQNPQSSVTQAIGPVRVTIDYSSPRVVRGKNDRRGKVWGELWVDNMRTDLRGFAGFNWQNWQQSAAFCAQNNINLPEALKWAERAVSDPTWSGGQENFTTLATLSRLQALNGRAEDAAKTFDRALNHPSAQPVQIHQAGRLLMTAGNKEQAMRVFQFNAKRFPNQWPVHVGLMRGYAAMGDKKKALEEAKLALAQAPDEQNRKNLQGLVKRLEEGKDIN